MSVSLESLELLPEELEIAKRQVCQLAYEKWLQAGSPEDGSVNFWLEAEREWIGRRYAPHRDDLSRP